MLAICTRFLRHMAILVGLLGIFVSRTTSGAPNSWARLLVPIGHGPSPGVPLTIRAYTYKDAMLSADGWFCYTQGRNWITLHGQKNDDGRSFRPIVTYEIATEGKTKWTRLRVESEPSHPDTVIVGPNNPTVNVTIDMEPFRGWIGVYRYGRVILENGDAGIIELEDLLPTANASDADGNFKEDIVAGGAMLRHRFKLPRANDPAVLSNVISLGGQLVGEFIFDAGPETVSLEGTRTLDGDFWPSVRLEAGDSDKDWKQIGKSPANGTSATLRMSGGQAEIMRVLLNDYKSMLKENKLARIVFSDGRSCVFYLDLLDPTPSGESPPR
jgi:hypothetical protein